MGVARAALAALAEATYGSFGGVVLALTGVDAQQQYQNAVDAANGTNVCWWYTRRRQ